MVGGGQSALESSALAYESGVQIELVHHKTLSWITGPVAFPAKRKLIDRILEPKAGIAPGWFNFIEESFPYSFQSLPRSAKDRFLKGVGAHGPQGSPWLRPRLIGKVPLHERTIVQEVKEANGGLQVSLSDNQTIQADHLILATGYHLDVKRLAMLGNSILPQIKHYHGAPELSSHFESSVPGLYFVGYTSYKCCGPYYRFVVGTDAAARRVAAAVTRRVRA